MLKYLRAAVINPVDIAIPISLRVSLIVAAAVVCVTPVAGVPAVSPPASSHILPGTMDSFYATPGDLVYSYGPSLEQRSLMDQLNVVTAITSSRMKRFSPR